MLRLLTLLTALLKDFRAGKLASPAPSACEAGAADAAGPSSVRFAAQPRKGRGARADGAERREGAHRTTGSPRLRLGSHARAAAASGVHADVLAEQEGDPALVRARAPWIAPSPVRAGGGIRATAQLL